MKGRNKLVCTKSISDFGIEGDLDSILGIIREMHETPFKKGVMRVITTVKIDDRRDKPATSETKAESVVKKMG